MFSGNVRMAGYRGWTETIDPWPVILAAAVVTGGWVAFAGLRFDWASAQPLILACIGLEMIATFYRTWRPDPKVSATLSGLAQIVAVSAVAATFSYAVASTGGVLWDETLVSWDRALGLDWRAYLAFFDARPRMALVGTLAYQSLLLQFLVTLACLGFSGHLRELRSFVLAFVLAAMTTDLLSGLLPAMGTYVHFGLHPTDFSHIQPAAPYLHVRTLNGLRDGTMRMMSVGTAEGIITFPSFHAVLGVMFTLALWPLRLLRWPILVLNFALIAATPIDGGHYFVDVMAGGTIGALAMLAARRLTRRIPNGVGQPIRRVADETRIEA